MSTTQGTATGGVAKGSSVAIAMRAVVTLPPTQVPLPRSGSKNTAAWVQSYFHKMGCDVRIEGLGSITVAAPNPAADALSPFVHQILDQNGNAMPDRRTAILQHQNVSHPFELQVQNGTNSVPRRFGFFATPEMAAKIGQSWQEGHMEFDLETLPEVPRTGPQRN